MPIPPFTPDGLLPPGQHPADWAEIEARYGLTPWRLQLLTGCRAALESLAKAGCERAWLDGSFVTDKEVPGDIDCCWDAVGVDGDLLKQIEPVLTNFDDMRKAQKEKFGCEFFPAQWGADAWGRTAFLDVFQIDKHTGAAKGIVALELGGRSR